MSKKEPAGLHLVRMAAWDMFEVDALPRRERKVRLSQMRKVLRDHGYHIHVGCTGKEKSPYYTMIGSTAGQHFGQNKRMGPLCARALKTIDNPER